MDTEAYKDEEKIHIHTNYKGELHTSQETDPVLLYGVHSYEG